MTTKTLQELAEVQRALGDARALAVGLENRLFDEGDDLIGIIEQVVNAIESASKSARIAQDAVGQARAKALGEQR